MSVKMCWKKGLISPERELHSGSSRVKCEIRWRCQKTHKYIIHSITEHVWNANLMNYIILKDSVGCVHLKNLKILC